MEVGQNIRKIRELKGYTQEYLAKELEISQRNYSRIENNELELNLNRLEKISNILDVSPQQIMGFDERFIFKNKGDAFGMNQNYYAYSEKEREQYENQIKHLSEEITFLRKQLEHTLKR
ncbi:MAG: transcriptional regulator [Verrucomicrobia bacterium]|nr:transcriptional regulator [Verrucomicrobiota bacterium]|tara:strand:+ start:562 stop:918 length:357 start_codon:yes stop_codon:yes gene_type:complete